MKLKILENKLKVLKMKNDSKVPELVLNQSFYSITRTDEELSIVLDENIDVESDVVEYNWRAIKIEGILDFSLIGILSTISKILAMANIGSKILAMANIGIFVISTYNTDYILKYYKDTSIGENKFWHVYTIIAQKN